ncbi:MAG: hypothetical protein HQK98_11435 [Nitrospirae bacterium]|nr:hypothetical protein [Nitrospirota bacterium]
MKKKESYVEIVEQYVSKAVLAEMLGVSLRTIQRFKRAGLPEDIKGYPLYECLKWYLNHLSNNGDSPTIADQKLRKLTAEADLLEMEIAKAKNSLIDVEDVRRVIVETCLVLKNVFLGLPGRLAMDLAAETDAAVVRNILMYEIKLAMNDASNRFMT